MDSLQTRLDALEQRTHTVERRLRWWRGLACGLLAPLVSLLCLSVTAQAAAPCHVPSSAYSTIQAAVNKTTCATINVAAGLYQERITINRSVTIRGAGRSSSKV